MLMTVKLSFEEAKQNLEAARARGRRALEAEHKAETQALEAKQKAEAREFEDKYRTRLEVLEEIWSESNEESSAASSENGQEGIKASPDPVMDVSGSASHLFPDASSAHSIARRRPVSDEVQIILDEMEDEIEDDEIITQITIREKYVEKYPGTDNVNLRSRISHTLKQLSNEDGRLELIQKGAGSEPSKYRLRKREGASI